MFVCVQQGGKKCVCLHCLYTRIQYVRYYLISKQENVSGIRT